MHGKAQLNWETLTESNNKGFYIEKSVDGRNFSGIGFVAGEGNSSRKNFYNFTDPATLQNVQYYRLKQSDRNGRFTYTQTVKLNVDGMPLQLVSVVNPMSTNLIFSLNDAPDKTVNVRLIDNAGRTVLSRGMSGNNSNVFRINVTQLPNAIYTLQIETEGLRVARRVVKQL